MIAITTVLGKLSNAELATVYNTVAKRPVTKFSDRAAATKRTIAVLEDTGHTVILTRDEPGWQVVAISDAPSEFGDRVITLLAETNPKTMQSKSYRRFACYRTGQTVQEFIREVEKLRGGHRRMAVRDLKWDESHGYISISK